MNRSRQPSDRRRGTQLARAHENFVGVRRLFGDIPQLDKTTNLYSYVILMGAGISIEKHLSKIDEAKDKRKLLKQLGTWNPDDLRQEDHIVSLPFVRNHLENIKKALLANGYKLKLCKIESVERVLVGTGEAFGKVPFDIGLAYDPILNVPYIPASSLKGAFRHALELKKGRNVAELVFGGEKETGLVGVTDAYPVEIRVGDQRGGRPRLFDPDVIAPHYPGKGKEIEVQPEPVVFATIAPGVVFEFFIYYNKELRARRIETSRTLDSSKHIYEGDLAAVNLSGKSIIDLPVVDLAIIYALTKGIGAKSSLGYSRFKLLEYRGVRQ